MKKEEREYWEDRYKAEGKQAWDRNWEHHKKMMEIQRKGNSGSGCFTPDMSVLTPKGWSSIADLQEGELVAQLNADTGAVEHHAIRRVKRYMRRRIYVVSAPGLRSDIRTTWAHSFRTQRGWVWTSYLKPSDRIQTISGPTGSLNVSKSDDWSDVLNLEVGGNKTFVVERSVVHCFGHSVLLNYVPDGPLLRRVGRLQGILG